VPLSVGVTADNELMDISITKVSLTALVYRHGEPAIAGRFESAGSDTDRPERSLIAVAGAFYAVSSRGQDR